MGDVGDIYRARARAVTSETARARGEAAKVMLAGLKEAVQAELYERTPLPVTHTLERSIRHQFRGQTVVVGFDRSIAPYVFIRINQKGVSVSGGHSLDMDPAAWIRNRKRGQIRAIMGDCSQRII